MGSNQKQITMKSMDLTQDQKDLLQMWANAKRTASCGGHHKAMMNENLQRDYAMTLREQGIIVYADLLEYIDMSEGKFSCNVDLPEGVFNGNGSY